MCLNVTKCIFSLGSIEVQILTLVTLVLVYCPCTQKDACQPCEELVNCPGCAQPLSQCQMYYVCCSPPQRCKRMNVLVGPS